MVIMARGESGPGQARRMQPATRFRKINSGACGRMLTSSLPALQTAEGIYHVEEAIASSALQIAPPAYERAHADTHPDECAHSGAWPLPLDRSRWQRGCILPLTVVLCCHPGDGAQPFQPAWPPRAGPHQRSCAVTFMSDKPRLKSRAILERHLSSGLMLDDVSCICSL